VVLRQVEQKAVLIFEDIFYLKLKYRASWEDLNYECSNRISDVNFLVFHRRLTVGLYCSFRDEHRADGTRRYSACITDTWTVSKQAEGSTFSLGLRDMTRRVRDCLGC